MPMDAEGIEYQPIQTWGELRTNRLFFTDVRVPRNHLIGEINQGWRYIAAALDRHRVKVGFSAPMVGFLESLRTFCSTTRIDGVILLDRPEIRQQLAEFIAEVEVVNFLSWEIAAAIDRGESPTISATSQKVLSSELRARLADFAMNVCGLSGQIRRGDSRAQWAASASFCTGAPPDCGSLGEQMKLCGTSSHKGDSVSPAHQET